MTAEAKDTWPPDREQHVLLKVEEAAKRLQICRATMFKLIGSGEIESVQIGRLRRVRPSALDDYVSRLSAKQGQVA
jgi:excisionase family DNA binding protein